MNRRSFLKMLGVGAVTVAAAPLIAPRAAPLFVPSERLDFGVPSERLVTATELPDAVVRSTSGLTWTNTFLDADQIGTTMPIPMLMLDDNFSREYGRDFAGHKIPAGATLLVDRVTAERWVAYGVATPGPDAPADLQYRAAARLVAKQHTRLTAANNVTLAESRLPPVTRAIFVNGDAPDITAGPLSWSGDTLGWPVVSVRARPDPFQRMIDRQMAKLKREQAAAEKWPE